MRRRALSTRDALNRHRWAVGLMESREMPGPASFRVHNAVLGYLREAGFSIEMTIQAYSLLDAYIYGFALQEKTVPFENPEEAAAVAREQVREYETLAEEQEFAAFAEEFPTSPKSSPGTSPKSATTSDTRSSTASISSSTRWRRAASRRDR